MSASNPATNTPTGFPNSPKLAKGALIVFEKPGIEDSVTKELAFQYNPETLSRTIEVWQPSATEGQGERVKEASTAQPSDPPQSFTLELVVDAIDDLGKANPKAPDPDLKYGILNRLRELERLLYPSMESSGLKTSQSGSLSGQGGSGQGAGGGSKSIPRANVPIVLFVWGAVDGSSPGSKPAFPGRSLPVRLTSFSVEEQEFLPILNPIRAKVRIGLRVLSIDELKKTGDKSKTKLAEAASKYLEKQRKQLEKSEQNRTG